MRTVGRVVITVVACCLPLAAMAQAEPNALLTAFSYGPIKTDQAIDTGSDDFTDANERLAPLVDEMLRDQGYTVQDDGPIRLIFSTAVRRRVYPPRTLAANPESAGVEGNQAIQRKAHVPIFEGRRSPSARRYVLSVRVFERASGRMLWQGSCTATILSTDRHTAFRAMVPVLFDYFGKNLADVQAQ
ncbi:MAG: hypothetical protein QNJ94_22120 [Alphaproteobacteria bacterium]|nr:hypothetical protein [Alphaproteobacteria bacterium]